MKLFFLMILALTSFAQEASPLTGDRFNCRAWRNFPVEQRIGYVMGFWEGASFALSVGGATKEAYTKQLLPFSGSSSYDEIRRGTESFCSAPENASIPVYGALMIFAAKANGASSEAIEQIAADFRKRAAATALGKH